MVSKEDFYKVWENPINALNQFYYEHYELLEAMEKINKAIEYIKTIKQHYKELRKAPFEDSVFINDILRQGFITTIESYLDLFLEILGDKEND